MGRLSVVIPIKDEQENLANLYAHVREALEGVPDWELVLVDDGSTDDSFSIMSGLARHDPRLKAVRLRRNFGQAAAMQAGIDHSSGEFVATMDGDLQNDARDLPVMLEKLAEGYDVCLGLRQKRKDAFVIRKLPSLLANRIIRKVTGLPFRDFGCTTRVMRSEVASQLRIYGEMHRFIPVLASQVGARMAQIPVRHHPRTAGKSKYGIGRTGRVVLDLITVKFLSGYTTRPMHFLGGAGLGIIGLSALVMFAAVVMKYTVGMGLTSNPLFLLSILGSLIGVQLVSMGLLGEVAMRTYFESQGKSPYTVRETVNVDAPEPLRRAA